MTICTNSNAVTISLTRLYSIDTGKYSSVTTRRSYRLSRLRSEYITLSGAYVVPWGGQGVVIALVRSVSSIDKWSVAFFPLTLPLLL